MDKQFSSFKWMFFFFLMMGMYSCSIKRAQHFFDTKVSEHYNYSLSEKPKTKSDLLKIESPLVNNGPVFAEVSRGKKTIIPLIVYNFFYEEYQVKINENLPMRVLSQALNTKANAKLKDKLNGAVLNLVIQQLPNSFIRSETTNMILGYGISVFHYQFENEDIKVNYNISGGDYSGKSGEIILPNTLSKMGRVPLFKSGIETYLADYDLFLIKNADLIINKILANLTAQ